MRKKQIRKKKTIKEFKGKRKEVEKEEDMGSKRGGREREEE